VISAIPSPSSVSTLMLCGANVPRSSSQRYLPKAGCPFARTGTRRHLALPQRDALEEGGHRLVAPVPGGQRWHGHRPIRGQHRDDGLEVGALPGVDEALDDLAQALVVQRAKQRLLAALGKPLVHRLVGALQRAVDPCRAPSPASGSSGREGRGGAPPPAERRRPRRPRGPPPGAGPRSRGAPHRRTSCLGLPEGDLAAGGGDDGASPPRRASRGSRSTAARRPRARSVASAISETST
jgi:hypothetical protein